MKSQLTWKEYQNSELTSQHSSEQVNVSFGEKLNSIWQSVLAYLAASSEPYVWKAQDKAGQVYWKAYDPLTKQSTNLISEAEMQVWLEERHYQYHHSFN